MQQPASNDKPLAQPASNDKPFACCTGKHRSFGDLDHLDMDIPAEGDSNLFTYYYLVDQIGLITLEDQQTHTAVLDRQSMGQQMEGTPRTQLGCKTSLSRKVTKEAIITRSATEDHG
ncbi:hypothetical protein MHU86_9409 [Fragilaria crotonensis]|nr:hypothetical protein MHU86_9409 [Fragilaria crotonensis]